MEHVILNTQGGCYGIPLGKSLTLGPEDPLIVPHGKSLSYGKQMELTGCYIWLLFLSKAHMNLFVSSWRIGCGSCQGTSTSADTPLI